MVTGISQGTISRAMELLELDTKDIAEALGCTRGTLNRWRRGAQDPSKKYRKQLELLDAFLHQLQKSSRSRSRAREWFDERIPALGNRRPRDVFMRGSLAHLVVYLRQHERL